MAWRLFNWGSRGATYETDGGVYVASILIPHCVQITVKGHTHDLQQLLHVFNARTANALPDAADVAAINAQVATWVFTSFGPDVVRDIDFVDEVVVVSRAEIDGPESTSSVLSAGGRGRSLGGLALPNEVTLAVKKNTGRAGRPYRGRFYAWPFWSTDTNAIDDGPNQVTDDFQSLLLSRYGNLKTLLNDISAPLGVASNVLGVITDITGFTIVDPIVDAQRRRGPGRGR